MYLVAGITGNTGAAAASALIAAGQSVRAIVRDKAKASAWAARGVELAEGELTHLAALTEAMQGVKGAYLLVPPNMVHPDPIGYYAEVAATVRQAATAAKLPRLVFLSSVGAQHAAGTGPIRGSHISETVLAGAAPQVTFLRASFFQENWQAAIAPAKAHGVVPTMLADLDARISMIATADIGRAAAQLLMEANPPALAELSSAVSYCARDAADAFAAALGRPMTLVQPPRAEWVGILTGFGIGAATAALLAEMFDGINSGHVAFSGHGRQMKGEIALGDTIRSWLA